MIPAIFSGGNTGFYEIGKMEADKEAIQRGACDVREFMAGSRRRHLLDYTEDKPLFRYYFNREGTEVGYFTYGLNCVQFHNTPRQWDAGYKAALKPDQLDDGRLALDTPERRDQEKYFGEGQEPEQEDDNE